MTISHITAEVEDVLKRVAIGSISFNDVLHHPTGKHEDAASIELMLSIEDVIENYGFNLELDYVEAVEIVRSNIREAYSL
jgi:hypothetical protein